MPEQTNISTIRPRTCNQNCCAAMDTRTHWYKREWALWFLGKSGCTRRTRWPPSWIPRIQTAYTVWWPMAEKAPSLQKTWPCQISVPKGADHHLPSPDRTQPTQRTYVCQSGHWGVCKLSMQHRSTEHFTHLTGVPDIYQYPSTTLAISNGHLHQTLRKCYRTLQYRGLYHQHQLGDVTHQREQRRRIPKPTGPWWNRNIEPTQIVII